MSYILDALKKSEREKTLGQVPTLETVIADGAKKQRSGTPWWLNLLVFIVAVLAVLAVLKMMNLIDFSDDDNPQVQNTVSSSQQTTQQSSSGQVSEQLEQSQVNETVSSTVETQPATDQKQTQPDVELVETVEIQQEPGQLEAQMVQLDAEAAQSELDALEDEAVNQASQQADLSNENQSAQIEEQVMESVESETQQPAIVEAQVETEQLVSNEPVQTEDVAAINNADQQTYTYEEDLHQDLRNISVNVVSYSSDAKQRFVMLDLTIYKEGDILPNDAEILNIIRNGAIVQYQNKQFLLKP